MAEAKSAYADDAAADWAAEWERALFSLLSSLPAEARARVASLAIDGTSATAMLVDANSGRALAPPKLYNEAQGAEAVAAAKVRRVLMVGGRGGRGKRRQPWPRFPNVAPLMLMNKPPPLKKQAIAPPAHTAAAPTSTLCKLLTWHLAGTWQAAAAAGAAPALLHQADWLAALLHGRRGVSDWNNALKLGFDPAAEAYPDWLVSQEYAPLLPTAVVAPGAPVAPLTPEAAARARLPPGALVCGGTTDSIAAFVAAGVTEVGQAVTSLGSTMAVKLLSEARVDDAAFGVYSHRLGASFGGVGEGGGKRTCEGGKHECRGPRSQPCIPNDNTQATRGSSAARATPAARSCGSTSPTRSCAI